MTESVETNRANQNLSKNFGFFFIKGSGPQDKAETIKRQDWNKTGHSVST